MTGLLALAGAGLGLVIGSFLATLILRWPDGGSVVTGRSRCDGCGRTLKPHELVPVLSWAVQRGECRTCGARIDPTHVLVELLCGAIGGLALWLAPLPEGLLWAVPGWMLLTLAILDWRHFWLPDALTLPLLALGLACGGWLSGVALVDRLIGAGLGFGGLFLIAALYQRVRGREGLGQGDAKLLGAIGAWLGWAVLPFLLLAASLIGLLLVAVAVVSGRAMAADTRLPLGTLLCLAALPAWACARALTGL